MNAVLHPPFTVQVASMPSSPFLSSPGTSRRSFLRLAGLAATLPVMSEGYLARAAMQTAPAASAFPKLPHAADAQAVMINANEKKTNAS